MAFSSLRDRLGIYSIGARKRETRSTVRQFLLSLLMILYTLTFFQTNIRDVMTAQSLEAEVVGRVRTGVVRPASAGEAYRQFLNQKIDTFSMRRGLDPATIPLPWERGSVTPISSKSFSFCISPFSVAICAGIQLTVSVERRAGISALQGRHPRSSTAGGGDLRARISLRSMDDFGELAELVNRLLDQFRSLVGGISAGRQERREIKERTRDPSSRRPRPYRSGASTPSLRSRLTLRRRRLSRAASATSWTPFAWRRPKPPTPARTHRTASYRTARQRWRRWPQASAQSRT